MSSPIILDIVEQFESPRLHMRCDLAGHGIPVYEAEVETYEQLKQWFAAWATEPSTLEQTEERIRKCRIEFLERTLLAYNCYLKETNQLIGRAWFSNLNWDVPKGNFALWLRRSFQAKGFGLEIASAFTVFGIEKIGLKRIESYVDPRNEFSRKLIDKLGYQFEGRMRNYSFDNYGVMRDYLIYSITPRDLATFKDRHQSVLAYTIP